jgi:hypothetical protein
MPTFNEQSAVQFLKDIRKPLLSLHKSILDHERAEYERDFGTVTPAAFLQELIGGIRFRWLSPLSTAIANIDELLDDEKVTAEDKIAGAQAIASLFASDAPDSDFRQRYLPLLQSPEILDGHGRIAQILRNIV